MAQRLASMLLFVIVSSSAYADVIVVDDDGGGDVDFTTVYEAVESASDGDTIFVRSGTYQGRFFIPTIIDGKGLSLVVEQGGAVELELETFIIQNLSRDQTVVMRGFSGGGFGLELRNNRGTVWFEDIETTGNIGTTLEGQQSDLVVIVRSKIDGLTSTIFGTPPEIAISLESCHVVVHDSDIRGGIGEGMTDQPGASAMTLVDSTLFVSGSTVHGGRGGTEPGGHGVVLENSTGRFLDSQIEGGDGTPPGSDIDPSGSLVEELDGVARSFSITAPSFYADPTELRFEGLPGEEVWLPHTLIPGGPYVDALQGVLVAPPFFLVRVGTLDSKGSLVIVVQTPEVSGLSGVTFFGQGLFYNPSIGLRLSAPSASVLLEPID